MAYAIGGWLAYRLFGHRVIEALYHGQGPAFFNSLIESQRSQPLSFYFELADQRFPWLHTLLIWLGALVWAQLRFGLVSASGVSRRARVVAGWLAGFAILPTGLLKAALFVPGALASMPRVGTVLPRRRVMLALLSVFGFAFLVAPYWMLPALPLHPIVAAALLACAGVWWAHRASGDILVQPVELPAFVAAALAGLLLAVAWPALTADIPWRGDEGYHLEVLFNACQHVVWVAVAVLAIAVVGFGEVGSRRHMAILTIVLMTSFALTGRLYDDQREAMARYPFFSRWLEAVPVQALVWSYPLLHDETSVRMISFLSCVCLAWVVFEFGDCRLTTGDCRLTTVDRRLIRFLFALAVATTPIVLAWATLLYLEPPALLLATLVAFDATRLLTSDPRAMRTRMSWLALLTIGFIKETAFPLLAAFVACRFAVRLRRQRSWRSVAEESVVALVVLAPVATYLVLARYGGGLPRKHGMNFANLGLWHLYPALVRSWLDQMGMMFALFVAGSIYLLRQREWVPVVFWWTTAVFVSAFHITDHAEFVGLSRFNLFIVPGVVAAATIFMRGVVFLSRAATAAVLVSAFALNAAFRPVHLDGSRVSGWGVPPIAGIGEETYPYSRTIEYLAQAHPTGRVLFTGMTFDYYLEFYLKRVGWTSVYMRRALPAELRVDDPDRFRVLQRVVRSATAEEGVSVVVFHPLAGDALPRLEGYELERVFETSTNRLAVYRRTR